MLRKVLPVFFLFFIWHNQTNGQACTTLGQTPQTAFPVCTDAAFFQSVVPECSNHSLPIPCDDGVSYIDFNPYWYSFTCYQSGTLGFLISPDVQGDDYDWQVFDITGHDPGDVYTNSSLFLVGNWSGSPGETGTSPFNNNSISCASDPSQNVSTYSKLPDLIAGHNYLLLVSHFLGLNQSGYTLTFGGGTAIIVDLLKPFLTEAKPICSGETIAVKVNKKMKCSSLDPKGTDFILSTNAAKIISAAGVNCTNGFDMDSLILTLDKPLPLGNYTVTIKNGTDGNTLLDNCDIPIPENTSLDFTVNPLAPVQMDSITPFECSPDELRLVFDKNIQCNSIAADGSDFSLTGPQSLSISGAYADSCVNGLSKIIKVKLNQPIATSGTYTLTLQKGFDGNTIVDECSIETPSSSIDFAVSGVVSGEFAHKLVLGCDYDTLYYAHDGKNGVYEWDWTFDKDGTSNAKDSFFVFKTFGTKHISLAVTNGVCTDSSSIDILLDNELNARFNVSPATATCPGEPLQFIDSSIGKIVTWFWTFGDGSASATKSPPPKYYAAPPTRNGITYPSILIVQNDIGCFDTTYQNIQVYYSCYIAVPGAFTPNGDGLNDYLYPLNAFKADNLQFRVYNRWGQLVFETKDWTKKWDGKINGSPQAPGTYVWMLSYKNHDTGQPVLLKGTSVLIR